MKAMNRAEEGFKSLEQHRGTFWDEPSFLKAYIKLGYAAKQEREAQYRRLVYEHLRELRRRSGLGALALDPAGR